MFNFLTKVFRQYLDTEKTDTNLINNGTINNVGRDQIYIGGGYNKITVVQTSSGLGHKYVKEHIERCENDLLNVDIKSFLVETAELPEDDDSLSSDDKDTINYYLYLRAVITKDIENKEKYTERVSALYKKQSELVEQSINGSVDAGAFMQAYTITRSVILFNLFQNHQYDNVLHLYTVIDQSDRVYSCIGLYAGFSCFNSGKYDKALEIFSKFKNAKSRAFSLLSSIYIQLAEFDNENREIISDDLRKLNELNDEHPEALKANEALVASANIRVNSYIDKDVVLPYYDQLSIDIKKHILVQLSLAQYYSSIDNYAMASDILVGLDWKNNVEIAVFYTLNLLLDKKYDAVIATSDQINNNKDYRIESFRLSALEHINKGQFAEQLRTDLNSTDDPHKLICYLTSIKEQDELSSDNWIIIDDIINNKELSDELDISNLLLILIKFEQYDKALLLLQKYGTESINQKLIPIVYNHLYKSILATAGEGKLVHKNQKILSNIEKIVDTLLEENENDKYVLQLKVMCDQYLNKMRSYGYYCRLLFNVTGDKTIAGSIIRFLYNQNDHDFSDYATYVSCLYDSDFAEDQISISLAFAITGNIERSRLHAYRAINLLDGQDDFNIYDEYFQLVSIYLNSGDSRKAELLNVQKSCVVTVKSDKDDETLLLCLDAEQELDNHNKGMNLQHLNADDPIYLKLLGGTKNKQVYSINGKLYHITNIEDRYFYTDSFVCSKLTANPKKSRSVVYVIQSSTPEDMIEKLQKSIKDFNERTAKLLSFYHFENNNTSCPIEFIVDGNYDKYISIINFLLYSNDEVIYTGKIIRRDNKKPYLISLPSLVTLCLTKQLAILDDFKDNIIIPETVLSFLQDRITHCSNEIMRSSQKVILDDDGKLVRIEGQDEFDKNIWSEIYNTCVKFNTIKISDEEVINFKLKNGISGDYLLNQLKIGGIQLDYLVVAKKIGGTYICDDLFIRKLALLADIDTNNVGIFAYLIGDREKAKEFVEKLSEVNYLWCPYLIDDDNDWNNRILQNLCKGKYKKEIYKPLITQIRINARKQLLEIYQAQGKLEELHYNPNLKSEELEKLEELRNKSDKVIESEALADSGCPPLF